MKHPLLWMLAILLSSHEGFAQNKFDTVFTLCGHTDSITASVKKNIYYLKVGNAKRQKIGNTLNAVSADTMYKNALNSLLGKQCQTALYDPIAFVNFVNAVATRIRTTFFPAPKPTLLPFPVVIDTIILDPTHYLGLIKTTDKQQIIYEYTLPNTSTDIFKWDSSGKLTLFDSAVIGNSPLLQRYFPKCLLLQAIASKAAYPQFYLLYNGIVPEYELITSYGTGVGNNTGMKFPAAIGDTIIQPGKETTLSIADKKVNVEPIKNTPGGTAATVNTAKPVASPKGRFIGRQPLTCPAVGSIGSYNLAAHLYLPSPSDSILLSLIIPGRTVPDTVMPIEFKMMELTNWVSSVLPPATCKDKQRDDLLASFAVQCKTALPYVASAWLADLQKAKADSAQAKVAPSAPAKKDSATASSVKPAPDTAQKANDSLAKYSMLNNITFLNAANFDFTGKLTASYLGVFDIFAPDFLRYRKFRGDSSLNRFGFIAGIEKINYGTANINGNDSTQTQTVYQYVLANPTNYDYVSQQIAPGSKYYYEYNKFTFQSKNTVWSLYFQPTWRTGFIDYTDKDPKVGLYIHTHFELLINQWTSMVNSQNLFIDSANYGSTSVPASSIQHYLPSQYTVSATILTENFGAGLTYYVAPFASDTNTHFFIQGTAGVSLNSPNINNLSTYVTRTSPTTVQLPNPNGTFSQPVSFTRTKGFYLIRAIFLQSLSNRTELIIGTTIRGLFGPISSNPPQYATYVGLNLDLSVLTDMFKSK